MKDRKRKVLILEDDTSLANAMVSFFSKKGIEAMATSKPSAVQDLLERQKINHLFVDCLLPAESGIDVIKGLRYQFPKEKLDVILMSGVFQDASFMRESVRETSAVGFLKKPFSLDELLKYVPIDEVQPEVVHPRKTLYRLLSRSGVSLREKKKAIEALEDIHGFDLPLIYAILSEAQVSGHLNIVSETGDVSGISFCNGFIVGVDIVDRETYLGKLLIEAGYVRPDDLEQVLSLKSSKRIGDRLIQSNLLSPHAFAQALSSQMSIRISRTLVDAPVRLNFVESEVDMVHPAIDDQIFERHLHDWIAGKISPEWLKAHYTQWGHAKIIKSIHIESKEASLQRPLVQKLDGVIDVLTSGSNIAQILEKRSFPDEPLLKCLHYLLIRGILLIDESSVASAEDRILLMRKMRQQFEGRNRMEIYDLMVSMTNLNGNQPDLVSRGYQNLLGHDANFQVPGADELYRELVRIGQEAYEFAKSGDREKMREDLLKGEIEKKLKATALFEEAKLALQRSQFKDAIEKLGRVIEMDPKIEKMHMYLAWAQIGAIDSSRDRESQLKEIDMNLMQVAPEDKFDAIYSFVSGLFHKAKGDFAAAKKSFEKAMALDSTLIVARREITALAGMNQAKPDLLTGDLKTLVGNLFRKK